MLLWVAVFSQAFHTRGSNTERFADFEEHRLLPFTYRPATALNACGPDPRLTITLWRMGSMNPPRMSQASFEPWWWDWAPRQERRETTLPAKAEVVVVGSGYTGLMGALTLARGGRDVLVLDAETVGFGASSRNGGQVGSGNQRFTVKRLIELYGQDKARALILEGTAALEYVKRFIVEEGIECHLRVNGRFRGASRPEHYEHMARDMEDLRAIAGVESAMVPHAEQGNEIGSELYHGGSVLPGDASVHPALYHDGLLQRAESAGVGVRSHTRVIGIEQSNEGATVITERGSIACDEVLIATNGYTTKTTDALYQRFVPVAAAMIATTELSPNLVSHLMPKARVYGDTLRVHHYYQPSPDNKRLLFGGRLAGPADTANPAHFKHLHREMLDVFPSLEDVDISNCWSGYVAITSDSLPHIGRSGRVYHATGYNGSGVARASHAGYQTALQMLGNSEDLTAWNDLAFEKLPFRSFARLGVSAAIAWKRWQDSRS
ncbi:MAG: FAD-binding oxidoreductase [Gammaproteobacteria bacterium]|nr:FAD-binding oxidoreductase [Gammaproteobacteria bacterium]